MRSDSIELLLLRHGKAESFPEEHIFRNLSSEGRNQALTLKERLNSPNFDLVVASELLRAVQTAALVGSCSEEEVLQIPSLFYHHDPETHLLDAIFREIGHATVSAWYDHKYGEVLRSVSKRAMNDIIDCVYESGYTLKALAVGHAILIPPMIDSHFSLSREVLDQPLPECSGFKICLEDKVITSVERI